MRKGRSLIRDGKQKGIRHKNREERSKTSKTLGDLLAYLKPAGESSESFLKHKGIW